MSWPVPQGGPQGGPPPAPHPAPQPKSKVPIVLGILIGAVAPWFGFVIAAVLGDVSDVFAAAPVPWVFVVLLVGAGLLFPERTRRWGLGILIGLFGMLIIGAGACVVFLIAVLSAYSGG